MSFLKFTISCFFLIFIWQIAVSLGKLPIYILPSPLDVLWVFYYQWPMLWNHTLISLYEIGFGLGLGILFAFLSALAIDRLRILRTLFMPILIVLQTIPIFALMPILLIWFGHGIIPKMIAIALSCYFPIISSFMDGLLRTPLAFLDLAHVMQYPSFSHWRLLRWVRLPSSMPHLIAGIKIAAAHAPITVIAADWIGAQEGLGYLIMLSGGRMELEIMFSCIILLMILGACLYFFCDRLKKYFLFWHTHSSQNVFA